jgi:hypothetical protein
MEGMVVLTGVNARGYGFVPLGIAIGMDCTEGDCINPENPDNPGIFDGHVNGTAMCLPEAVCPPGASQTPLPVDHLGLLHAKAHSGLEGQDWMTITLAMPIRRLAASNTITAAAIVTRSPEGQAPASDAIAARAYPSFPSRPTEILDRQLTVAGNAEVHWVTVATAEVNGSSTRWNVYFPQGGGSFTAPALPAGVAGADPFAASDGSGDVTAGHVNVTQIGFTAPGASLQSLAANDGTNLNDLLETVEAFAVQSGDILARPCAADNDCPAGLTCGVDGRCLAP